MKSKLTKAVIFDLDGVIVDSVGFSVDTYIAVLSKEGYTIEKQFIAKRIGIGTKQVLQEEFFDSQKMIYKGSYIDSLIEKIEQYQIEHASDLPGFPQFYALAKKLKPKKIALATMRTKARIAFKLKKINFNFDKVLTAEDGSLPKPFPDIYLKTALQLKVEPEECIVIEDSHHGVQAAKNAGMRCIGVTTGYYGEKALLEAGADSIVKSLDEKKILEFIEK